MTIVKEFIKGKEKALTPIKKEIEITDERIERLLDDSKVMEYILMKEEQKSQEKRLKRQNEEYIKSFQTICNHPIYALIGIDKKHGVLKEEIHCILCGKEIKGPDIEYPQWLETLFKNKRLIAHYRNIVERTGLPHFNPYGGYTDESKDSIENLRNEYILYTLENEKLLEYLSLEDAFFDSFCNEDYERYKNDRIGYQKVHKI